MLIGKVVRLEPNIEQEEQFKKFAGTSRFAWNESKAFCDSMWEEKGEYATLSDLMKHLQNLKHNDPQYEWLNTVPEAITKQAMKDLLKAYKKFYKDLKANAFDKSNPDKYKPNFKKKNVSKESFYQRTDNIRKTDNTHVKITGIKKPVKCSMLKDVELPKHIQNPRITYDGKYWYLSYSYEVEEKDIVEDFEIERIGIDLGIKDFAIISTGEHYCNINKGKEIRGLRKRLKRIQKQISRKYEANATIIGGKKVYHKTNNIKKLEIKLRHIYRRIANIQKTYMYEVIKAVMKTKPQSIVLEDLSQYELASIAAPDLCALRAQITIQIRVHPERSVISQSELELPLRLICSPHLRLAA